MRLRPRGWGEDRSGLGIATGDEVLYRDEIEAAHHRIVDLERKRDTLEEKNAALRATMRKRARWQVGWLASGVALGALVVAIAVVSARPRQHRVATVAAVVSPPPAAEPAPPPAWKRVPGFDAITGVASSTTAHYAVGPGGVIWRHASDGEHGWTREASGTKQDLLSVLALGNEVIAVGRGGTSVVLDRGGTRWVSATGVHVDWIPTWRGRADLFAVRWLGDDTGGFIFAVGAHGTILRELATEDAFEQETSPTRSDLFDVCGNGGVHYAVGAGGTILHWAGRDAVLLDLNAKWTVDVSPTKSDLFAVWCDREDAYAAGAGGVILHKHGQRGLWTFEASGTTATLRAIEATGGPSAGTCGTTPQPRRITVGGDGATLLENRGDGWVRASTNGLEGDVRSMPGGMVLTSRGLFTDGRRANVPPPLEDSVAP
jgi:hypothetical protein